MNISLQALQAEFERLVASDPLPLPPAPPPAPAGQPPAGEGSLPLPPSVAPPPQVQSVDSSARGFGLDVRLKPGQVVAAAEIMDRHGFAIDAVTGVDWLAQQEMEVVYDYFHPAATCRVVVRARAPRDTPEFPTISGVYAGANWHERETAEFFGIRFPGHPNLIPLLLPEDADFHPLRKDFKGL